MLELTQSALAAQCAMANALSPSQLVTHLVEAAPDRFDSVASDTLLTMHAEAGTYCLDSGAVVFALSDGRFFHRSMRDTLDLDFDRAGVSTGQHVDATLSRDQPQRVVLEMRLNIDGAHVDCRVYGRYRIESALRGWLAVAPFYPELLKLTEALADGLAGDNLG